MNGRQKYINNIYDVRICLKNYPGAFRMRNPEPDVSDYKLYIRLRLGIAKINFVSALDFTYICNRVLWCR